MAEHTIACSLKTTSCTASSNDIHLKIVGIFSIFTACALGVCIPILGPRLFPSFNTKSNLFIILKAFSAGVVLGTAFVHMLPDAFDTLANPCLGDGPWQKFPLAGFTAMLAALCTLLLDVLGNAFYESKQPKDGALASPHANIVSACREVASVDQESNMAVSRDVSMEIRYTVVAQVMELGMVAHSIIIGISLGTSHSPCTIKPLVTALTFHQMFEGLALGGCLSQAAFRNGSIMIMCFIFSITTPTGIAIGMGVSSVYDRNSVTAILIEGMFDAISAGILVYMALVDLIATDFLNKQDEHSLRIQLAAYVSLVCGAAAMAVVALWA